MNVPKFTKKIFLILYAAALGALALLYAAGMVILQLMVMEEPDYSYSFGRFVFDLIFLIPLAVLVWGCYLSIKGIKVFTQDEPLRRSRYQSLQ